MSAKAIKVWMRVELFICSPFQSARLLGALPPISYRYASLVVECCSLQMNHFLQGEHSVAASLW